jgi:hypothetical protein
MQIILNGVCRNVCAALAVAACWQGGAAAQETATVLVVMPRISASLPSLLPLAPLAPPEPEPEQGGRRSLPMPAAPAAVTVADSQGFDGQAVPVERLARLRGGADTVSNDMRLNGAVSGNSAINVFTGSNTISDGSFSNASGLPVAIQNSGANVLIQNATIINIQMQ